MPGKEKQEIEQLLNELFGVKVRWSRLSRKDLEQIVNALSSDDRCRICEKLDCVTERYPVLEVAIKGISKKGPLMRMLQGLLLGEGEEDSD